MQYSGSPVDRIEVGLDVTSVVTGQTGLNRYTTELWRELAAREDVGIRAFALGRGSMPSFGLPVRRLRVPLRLVRSSWRYLRWPRAESLLGPIDVVHSPALTAVRTRHPLIATVHDVIPLTHPEFYPPGTERAQRRELASATRADLIVATCDATADEVARVSGFRRERIVVAPLGAIPLPADGGAAPPVGPYALVVSTMTPRKGLDVLAEAVARIGPRCPRVVIAGPDYWKADEVRQAIAAADRHGRVDLLGPVDDATLGGLYRGATVVCVPSRAEGFGLPCLEALAAGVPLVASDLPPVREIVDGAAELVPPDDPEALAEALARLFRDEERRRQLAAAGRGRAARFTWSRTAEDVVRAYRLALAREAGG